MVCKHCGEEITNNSKYCNFCGKKIPVIKEKPIKKEKTIETNSMHHQSIKNVAEGWRVCAKAPDGTIEAIELPNYSFALGLQWHPEHLFHTDEKARLIFKRFIDSCVK